jgi:hypothetical protein
MSGTFCFCCDAVASLGQRGKMPRLRLGRPRIAPELEGRIRKALAIPGRSSVRKIAAA